MTENTPIIVPDDPHEKVDETLEDGNGLAGEPGESVESSEEPDLLFAHINALMDGSDAPEAEPINLDEQVYPEESDSEPPPGASDSMDEDTAELPQKPPQPAAELDDNFPATDEIEAESIAAVDAATVMPAVDPQAETDTDNFFDEFDDPGAETALPIAHTNSPLTDPNATLIELGFYGKLPTYGDFIQKRLPQNFINPWHEWLQAGMLANRERDIEGWKSYYLNCPAWCFVLAAGICGDQPVAGVTIPSVDRVGRYFNFTMASILPADTDPAVFASARQQWFTGLEDFALSVLDQEMDQDSIDRSINELSIELGWDNIPRALFESGENQVRVHGSGGHGLAELMPALLHQLISRDQQAYGLWWHRGSSQVSAQLLSCAAMPGTEAYLDLLMDRDLRDTVQSAQDSEMDYLDELLSD